MATKASVLETATRLQTLNAELLAMLKAQRCDHCGYHLGAPRSLGGYACETCAPARAVIAAAESTS